MSPNSTHLYSRLPLTDVTGGLRRALRSRLQSLCDVLRLREQSCLVSVGTGEEEVMLAALKDKASALNLLEGFDAVLTLVAYLPSSRFYALFTKTQCVSPIR
jgi:hypothetical protein